MYNYFAYGLTISSDIELSELLPVQSDRSDLALRAGRGLEPPAMADDARFGAALSRAGAALTWSEIGTFLVSPTGESIVYECPTGTDPDYIRLALLGPVLGAALSSLERLVLHAGSSLVHGSAALFVGPSGSGKSTMVAAMAACGYPMLCDDITSLQMDAEVTGDLFVHPGIPRVKLWPDSLGEALPLGADATPLYRGFPKVSVAQETGSGADPVPVKNVFVLAIGETLKICPLTKHEGLLALISNCYVGMLDKKLGKATAARDLTYCGKLSAAADFYLLERPADLAQLPSAAALVASCVSEISVSQHESVS